MARTPKVVEDRREQIAEAAMRVFAEKGFTRATNKDIAREAGITTGLIYHYFDSKEALLKAIVEMNSPVQFVHTLAPEMLGLTPEKFIRTLLLHMLNIVESEQFVRLLRVFLPETIHNPGLSTLGLPSHQEATRFLENYLQAKTDSGELRHVEHADPSMVAQALMSGIMGFVLRRQILHDPSALRYTREEIVDGMLGTVLLGLLP
jgi:AcrR family transcriptional regulator